METHSLPSQHDTFLTPQEFMARYRMSRTQFYKRCGGDPSFPPLIKIGSATRLSAAAADSWARSLPTRSKSESVA
jgi:predicted DNA-binding transcriptional regulator AlpA